MAIVDDRGRVSGRFNAVDVFVFALVVVMIPIAYGAYALFRTPPAKLRGVEPKQFTVGPNLRVRVNGTNLRPFMRVSFNTTQGRTFMIGSTETAEVELPDLEPGAYDVVLYDYAQEVDRLPKALTILPKVTAPTVKLTAHGTFVGLNDTQIAGLQTGVELTQNNRAVGRILAVGQRRPGAIQMRTGDSAINVTLPGQYDVPAVLEVECFLENNNDGTVHCTTYGPAHAGQVAVDSVLSVPIAGHGLEFQVNDVHPLGRPTFLRLVVRSSLEITSRLHVGDSDSNVPDYPAAWVGRVEGIKGADVVLRVPAQQLVNGFKYRNQFLKVGSSLKFESSTVVITGTITDVTPIDQTNAR